MVRRIKEYIQQYHMIHSGDAVVAGVSGGADSVCLLFLLKELRKKISFRLMVVHVNHGIRAEAEEDEAYVKELCDAWEIPFFAEHADIPKLAKEQGISEEEAGRNARYEAFERLLRREAPQEWEEGKAKIAVAHNSNDRAETMLFHLFRGTGLQGLCSIQPVRDRIIRPLLCVERQEIEAFLQKEGIRYCVDSTNAEDTYTRNRIRNQLFPYIQEHISGAAIPHMNHTADLLTDARDYVNRQTKEAYDRCVQEKNTDFIKINVEAFCRADLFLQGQMLLMALEKVVPARKDITAAHVEALRGLVLTDGSKSIDLPYGMVALKEYNRLTIAKKEETVQANLQEPEEFSQNTEQVNVSIPGCYSLKGIGEIEFSVFSREKDAPIPQNEYTKWFDYDKIEKSLVVRKRRTGDYLTINEELSRKSLKEYLIDEKIPKFRRDDLWILAEDGHVLWVIGHRISTKYKISENTKRILQVQLRGGTSWQNM